MMQQVSVAANVLVRLAWSRFLMAEGFYSFTKYLITVVVQQALLSSGSER